MSTILVINGSYRAGGVTDQMVALATQTLVEAGADVEVIVLRETPIQFCLNCRQCTQTAGSAPGECVHDDEMVALVKTIEAADAYILASPTNFASVTAIFKRFMERLVVYGYWPWEQAAPKMRRPKSKKALLLSSCAAPSLLGRWSFSTLKQLKLTAHTIGANVIGSVNTGLIAQTPTAVISQRIEHKIRRLALKLIN